VKQNHWSVPETELRQHIARQLTVERRDVLATIVDVEGNAYRRPGAKMLLTEDGDGVGNVTAGCLENELLKASEQVRNTGQPERVTYDLMEDEDDVWGLGVGCDGVINVLLEPLANRHQPMATAFEDGQDISAVTVLTDSTGLLSLGDRAYVDPEESTLSVADRDRSAWPSDSLVDLAVDLARTGQADTVTFDIDGREVTVFVDGLQAPSELVVFGTGHDVGPVTELAAKSDFRVTVIGFRGGVDIEERFPHADQVQTTSPSALREDLALTDRTYTVVMTHNFVDDRLTIEQLLEADVPYIGLMGPEERFQEMLEQFDAEKTQVDEADFDRLYTPIGLDLGGGSPYQIAHRIVAEVLAVSNDRCPDHLRAREGPIHERVDLDVLNGAGTAESD
jgi:xanthine dehydrogenase accessory factor